MRSLQRLSIGGPSADREAAERRQQPAEGLVLPVLVGAHEAHAATRHARCDRRVEDAAMGRRQDEDALRRHVLAALDSHAAPHAAERRDDESQRSGTRFGPAACCRRASSRSWSLTLQQLFDPLEHLVDAEPGGIYHDRAVGLDQRAVRALSCRTDRDARSPRSISSTSPPASATRRSARTRGDGREVQLQLGVGEHDRPDVAALEHSPAALIRPVALAPYQLGADRAVGSDRADRAWSPLGCGSRSSRRFRRRAPRVRRPPGSSSLSELGDLLEHRQGRCRGASPRA